LMADRKLPYGYVVEVMAAVQRAGVTNLGMITNPTREKEEANASAKPGEETGEVR
ncbi:MAG TPA: protein TolR, partial [Anaeromyxobacteraceae bacterium]|nr:protein TolR [Anaeromyxobacteraceae bacterium]